MFLRETERKVEVVVGGKQSDSGEAIRGDISPGTLKDVAIRVALVTWDYHSLKVYVFFLSAGPKSATDPI